LPYKEIIDQAATQVKLVKSNTSWYDWERYSNRQQQRMNMGGIVGELVYEGELAPFLPLLRLGMYTHIGKNTTFGLGKYVARGE
jgi:CRISPR/Cas system endoribonuclease Cas6 (RAMP superfamily)